METESLTVTDYVKKVVKLDIYICMAVNGLYKMETESLTYYVQTEMKCTAYIYSNVTCFCVCGVFFFFNLYVGFVLFNI